MGTVIHNKETFLKWVGEQIEEDDMVIVSTGVDGTLQTLTKRKLLRVPMAYAGDAFVRPIGDIMHKQIFPVGFILAKRERLTEAALKVFDEDIQTGKKNG